MRHLAFRVRFFTNKSRVASVPNVKLEINTLFTPKATHSLAILMILSAIRSLSLVPICKYLLPHPFCLNLDKYDGGNVLMLYHRNDKSKKRQVQIALYGQLFKFLIFMPLGILPPKKDYIIAVIRNILIET